MSDVSDLPRDVSGFWSGAWLNRLVARPGFQRWAARFPLTRRQARADGAALFEIVQGFVASQALLALVQLDIPERLRAGPMSVGALALACRMPERSMRVLLQAGAALGLLKRRRDDRFQLARKGAALLGVPGLDAMIRHHPSFYEDMRDPVALLRGEVDTALSHFWPYVFAGAVSGPDASRFSDLMAQSQSLVAQDTLAAVSFKSTRHLLDVGGGNGAFLAAVGNAASCRMTLFDLPQVIAVADARLGAAGLSDRVTLVGGSFRDDPLPRGADTVSLIRVLYDHKEDTVLALLRKVRGILPSGGRLVISEPMSGGATPDRAGDVYFAFYTLAMQTGCTRSAEEIADLCRQAGFSRIAIARPHRPYVTQVLTAFADDTEPDV